MRSERRWKVNQPDVCAGTRVRWPHKFSFRSLRRGVRTLPPTPTCPLFLIGRSRLGTPSYCSIAHTKNMPSNTYTTVLAYNNPVKILTRLKLFTQSFYSFVFHLVWGNIPCRNKSDAKRFWRMAFSNHTKPGNVITKTREPYSIFIICDFLPAIFTSGIEIWVEPRQSKWSDSKKRGRIRCNGCRLGLVNDLYFATGATLQNERSSIRVTRRARARAAASARPKCYLVFVYFIYLFFLYINVLTR